MWISHRIFATLFQFVSSVISSPQAAVGADLSCPHIRKCPQNGEQKCVCGDLNIRILRCGHPFAMKRIHGFDNGKYGFDNVRIRARWIGPYAWRSVRWVFLWAFVGDFVGECGYFAECSPHYSNPLVALWQGTSSCRGRFIVPAYMYAPT